MRKILFVRFSFVRFVRFMYMIIEKMENISHFQEAVEILEDIKIKWQI